MKASTKFHGARYLSLLLAVALVVAIGLLSVPYVVFSPGPTVNVLGKFNGQEVIQISGHETFRDDGDLRLTTVVVSSQSHRVNLFELGQAWFSDDQAIYPREVVYHEGDTNQSVRQQSALEMTSSKDAAVAAALNELRIPVTPVVKILGVVADGPAAGKLQNGDIVETVNGKKVADSMALVNQVQSVQIGDPVTFVVRRQIKTDGKTTEQQLTVKVNTVASVDKPVKPAVRAVVGRGYEFPFEVDLSVGDAIGGPSGGLMFALGIYDLLTPGSLTGGKDIAGTGEITPDGKVGSIGGIQQKIAASQGAGAKLFFVPASNCDEAVLANYDPKQMRLVRAETLDDAVKSLETWSADPTAKLPACPKK